jgi:hypothetical protein
MPAQLCTVKGCPNEGRYCRFHKVETFKGFAPLKTEADVHKLLMKSYKKIAKIFMTKNRKCQVKGCKKPAECIHHKAGRIGEKLLDQKNFLAVCMEHHRMIEDNPAWAKENGYSILRLAEGGIVKGPTRSMLGEAGPEAVIPLRRDKQ